MAVAVCLLPVAAFAQTAELQQQRDRTVQQQRSTEKALEQALQREGSARDRLAQIEWEYEQARNELAERERELEKAQQALEVAEARAGKARERLREVEAKIVRLDAEHDEKRTRLEGRLRAAFKFGSMSFADTLTTVHDMADFLNSTTYVSHVVAADRDLVAEVEELIVQVQVERTRARKLRAEAEREAARASQARERLRQALAEQEELTAAVERRRVEHAEALEALREDTEALRGHLDGLKAEAAKIQTQLTAIAQEQAAQAELERAQQSAQASACETARTSGHEHQIEAACDVAGTQSNGQESQVSGEGWLRPVDGAVSSPFGSRPSLGGYHYGVDFRGAVGTAIRAARAGTVVTVVGGCHPTNSWTCGGGFGNYVVVAHDGGYATLYAHLSTISVGVGESVAQGQVIGAVGNSGRSYGPHLHFELYDGGNRNNPCGYVRC